MARQKITREKALTYADGKVYGNLDSLVRPEEVVNILLKGGPIDKNLQAWCREQPVQGVQYAALSEHLVIYLAPEALINKDTMRKKRACEECIMHMNCLARSTRRPEQNDFAIKVPRERACIKPWYFEGEVKTANDIGWLMVFSPGTSRAGHVTVNTAPFLLPHLEHIKTACASLDYQITQQNPHTWNIELPAREELETDLYMKTATNTLLIAVKEMTT